MISTRSRRPLRPSRRQLAALAGFSLGILALALHIAGGGRGADLLFGALAAAVLAGYGFYELRRA